MVVCGFHVATVLASEPPRHADETRLAEVAATPASFQRERDALERRVTRLVPQNLLYRVETPHGSIGFRPPTGISVGTSTVQTTGGPITIRVWYA